MATSDYTLASPPDSPRDRELWLQHAAGFILFKDVRDYAAQNIDPDVDDATRTAVKKGIDDAVYGLMMVLDGVTGALSNDSERIQFRVVAQHVRQDNSDDDSVISEVNLANGDGMCMGYHGWLDSDFGSSPIVELDTDS